MGGGGGGERERERERKREREREREKRQRQRQRQRCHFSSIKSAVLCSALLYLTLHQYETFILYMYINYIHTHNYSIYLLEGSVDGGDPLLHISAGDRSYKPFKFL